MERIRRKQNVEYILINVLLLLVAVFAQIAHFYQQLKGLEVVNLDSWEHVIFFLALGGLLCFNGCYLVFTRRWSVFSLRSTLKERLLWGYVLLFIGIFTIIRGVIG